MNDDIWRGALPPYDQEPDDEDAEENDLAEARAAAERIAIAQSKEARFRAALEHLATPNRGARPTGRDALDMAAYARRVLDEVDA